MGKHWRIAPHDPDSIAFLEREARVSPVLAQILAARGATDPQAIAAFLDPKLSGLRDPDELPGVPQAADRIHAAINARRPITIYGDYDADGMTATALLHRCFSLLGADVRHYVPNRCDEGYGLNDDALRTIAARGPHLVVTVDCGIGAVHEAQTARELGLELIITDHHAPGPRLPDAAAIVHPRLPGRAYPFGELCGCGVAFKLAWAVCQRANNAKRVSERMRQFMMQAVGLAALGTVADVVPLVDENRILVANGLNALREHPTLGLQKLMELTQLHEKPRLTSEDLAFTIGPRINAAGRLGQAQLAVELLTTESPTRAASLAEYIHELNNSRGSLERSIYIAANKQVQQNFDPDHDPALVLADYDWHPGVIGIVAGKLAEKYHCPVVMIALDKVGVKPGIGSARSVPGYDLHAALANCADHLLSHGGHAAAAGLTIDAAQVAAFRAHFCEHVAHTIGERSRVADLAIDAETPLSMLTPQTVQQIERLAPFGAGNPRPMLCATAVELAEPPKCMGEGGRHVQFRLRQSRTVLRGVAFGQGEWADELANVSGPLSIAYRPVINEFRGRRSVELHVADWKAG